MRGLSRLFTRGKITVNYPEDYGEPQQNDRGDICIAQALPQSTELTRLGFSWIGGSDNLILAGLGTVPSFLYGIPNRTQSKVYIIDTIIGEIITNATPVAALKLSLFASVTSGFIGATGFGLGFRNLSSGRQHKNETGTQITVTASPLFPPSTHPIGNAILSANTNCLTLGVEKNVYGRYIIPPGYTFGAGACSQETVASGSVYRMWIQWHEAVLPLGSLG